MGKNDELMLISLEETARILDVPVKTIRNQLSEGRFPIVTIKHCGARKVPKHLVIDYINGLISDEMKKTVPEKATAFEFNNRGRSRKAGSRR